MKSSSIKINYRLIEEKDKVKAIACLIEAFCYRESLALAIRISKHTAEQYAHLLVERAIPEKLGFVAVFEETQELAACMIGEDLRGSALDLHEVGIDQKFIVAAALLKELNLPLRHYSQNANVFYHAIIGAVNEEFTRKGIFNQLMRCACKIIYEKGYQYFVAEYSSPYSYKSMVDLDGNAGIDLNKIYYRDFIYAGKKIFQNLPGMLILRISKLSDILKMI